MKERFIQENIEHPEADLQLELVSGFLRMKHLYGSELVDPIKKRVDDHNEACSECRQVLTENIKFY